MIKLFSLIILTLIINERTIQCQSEGDKIEEDLYTKAKIKCNAASNEKLKCFEDGIYYLDINENQNWEKARQLCSQKFHGSSYADLISLEGVQRVDGAKAILKNYDNKGKSINSFALIAY